MKKLLFFLVTGVLVMISNRSLYPQVPRGFNYQALATTSTGSLLSNITIGVKIGILSDTVANIYVWEELHTVTTNSSGVFSLVVGTGTKLQGSAATFDEINWGATPLFFRTRIYYLGTWKTLGSAKLWSVPYSLVSGKTDGISSGAKLAIVSSDDESQEALFEVKRKDGQTVFAVYSDAVNVFVPDQPGKAKKGGFAIGGFDKAKGSSQDLFSVTSDSIRMYINNNPAGKGVPKGGFAIGGFDEAKRPLKKYLSLYGASTIDTLTNASQILWYPNKEAFLAGRIEITNPDSVGRNSFSTGYKNKAIGDYSHALGYEAVARGDYSTAIGRSAISGPNSFALGNFSSALGNDSYAVGSDSHASGSNSFALGVGSLSSGTGSLSLGFQSHATFPFSTSLGFHSIASNQYSVAIGYYALASGFDSYAIGSHAKASEEKSFAIGSYGLKDNGSQDTNRLTLATGYYSLAFGMGAQSTKVGAMALGVNSTAGGNQSVSIGFGTSSTGQYSTSMGYKSIANGFKSISIGAHYHLTFNKLVWQYNAAAQRWIIIPVPVELDIPNIADGEFSIAIGNGNSSMNGGLALGTNNNAMAFGSVAIGHSNVADSAFSFVAGFNNNATGIKAFALGENLTSSSAGSFVIGAFNLIEGSQNEWIPTDPLFVIGNGNPISRSNAFKVLKDGNIVLSTNLKPGTGESLVVGPDGSLMRMTSSARFKSEINPVTDISWLYKLRPVSFVYNSDKNRTLQYGLIAEEVEKANRELVIYSSNRPEGINYNGLFAPMLKAIQDQMIIIDDLKSQNNILINENDGLKLRVEKLENIVSIILSGKK